MSAILYPRFTHRWSYLRFCGSESTRTDGMSHQFTMIRNSDEPTAGFFNSDRPWVCWTTLWVFNIAMENGPFIDDFPIKTSIYEGFSMAMLNNQMVN